MAGHPTLLQVEASAIERSSSALDALAVRRSAAETRLEELKSQRGVAMLDGNTFAGREEIMELEIELDAIAAAEGEAVRRERLAAERNREHQREAKRQEVRDLEHKRIEAVRAAENAATDLMVALKDVDTIAGKLDSAIRLLGVRSFESPPQSHSVRLSHRLAAVMRPILTNGERQYGSIEFPNPYDFYSQDWVPAEEAVLARDIATALLPTTQKVFS